MSKFLGTQTWRPVKGKIFTYRNGLSFFIMCILKLLPLQGALLTDIIPRALPWAKSFCPFRACWEFIPIAKGRMGNHSTFDLTVPSANLVTITSPDINSEAERTLLPFFSVILYPRFKSSSGSCDLMRCSSICRR